MTFGFDPWELSRIYYTMNDQNGASNEAFNEANSLEMCAIDFQLLASLLFHAIKHQLNKIISLSDEKQKYVVDREASGNV